MGIILDSEMEDFNRILADHGYSNDSFELIPHEDPLPASGDIAPITGHVTVKHRESGIERTYKAGHLTTWVPDFTNDLTSNVFPTDDKKSGSSNPTILRRRRR